jgi:hypothetical protein
LFAGRWATDLPSNIDPAHDSAPAQLAPVTLGSGNQRLEGMSVLELGPLGSGTHL